MRIVDRPFASGPRQDVDRAVTPEGAVYRVENGRQRSGMAWGKRHGYTAVDRTVTELSEAIEGTPTAIGEAAGREVLASDGRVFCRESDGATWQEAGRVPRYMPRAIHWIQFNDANDLAVSQYDIAAAGDLIVVAFYFVDASGNRQLDVQAMDQAGARVFARRLEGYFMPRLLAFGGSVILTAVHFASLEIRGFAFDVAARTLSLPVSIGSIAAYPSYSYDVCALGTALLVASVPVSGTLRVKAVSAGGVFSSGISQDIAIAAGIAKPTVYAIDGVAVWASVLVAGTSYTLTLSTATLDVIAGPDAFGSGAASEAVFTRRSASTVWMLWREFESLPSRYTIGVGALSVGNVQILSPTLGVHHMQLASLPHAGDEEGFSAWLHTDNGYIPLLDTLTQAGWALQRKYCYATCSVHLGTTSRVVIHPELTPDERSHFDSGDISTDNNEGPWLPHTAELNGRLYQIAITPLRTQSSNGVRSAEASALVVYEYEAASRHTVVTAGGAGAIFGGHLQEVLSSRLGYDPSIGFSPVRVGVENGFVRAPAILASALGSGGTLALGLYQACATYEYIDADGRRHRSAPSGSVSFTVSDPASAKNTITIAAYSAFEREVSSTAHQTAVHVWCTSANGETFYRVSPDQGALPAYSDDAALDFTIETDPNTAGEPLYTDGGVWPVHPAPAHRFGCLAGDRLVVGGLFDRRVIEVSRSFRPNSPAEFTRAPPFRAVLPEPCTALGYLDGQIVAFSERGIFLLDATQPPNDQGYPGLGSVVPLPTDVGAIDGSPVVQLPGGLIFQSRRGIYILPRGFGPPRLLSGPVKEDLQGRPVLSAGLVHYAAASDVRELSGHYVYFAVGTADEIDFLLVLDADTMQWISRDVVHGTGAARARVLGAWNGKAVLARDPIAGVNDLVQEDPGSFLDQWATADNLSPVFRITTGEIRPFAFAGRGKIQNVRLFGEIASGCSVKLLTVPDGRYSQEIFNQPALNITGARGDRLMVDFTPRAEAAEVNAVSYAIEIGLELSEGEPQLADREGVLLHGLGLTVEPIAGMKGLPASRRV